MLINEKTELKPSDLIKSPKGKVYKIDTYSGDKNTYRIYLIPAKAGEENPPFSIITKQNLVAKKWELASKEDIKEKNVAQESNIDIIDGCIISQEIK